MSTESPEPAGSAGPGRITEPQSATGPRFSSRSGRVVLLVAALGLFVIFFFGLHAVFGDSATLIAIAPVILGSWLFGLPWGVLLTVFVVLPIYNVLINLVLGESWFALARTDTLPALLSLVLISVVVGLLRQSRDEIARQSGLRARREVELHDAERRLRLMVEQLPAVIWSTDCNLTFDNMTGAGLRNFNAGPETFLGRTLADFFEQEAEAHVALAAHQRALAGEAVAFDLYWSERYFQVYLEPLRDETGVITGVLGLALDVTEQRQSELALRRAQKMESLGVLTGGIAHDFNNLLVAVLGQTSLALTRLATDDPAREHLEKAMAAVQQASGLTQQMLAFAGREQMDARAGAVQAIDLNELVEANIHLFGYAMPPGTEFTLDLSPNLPLIAGNAGQLQQVVMNLLLNAAEAYEGGGGTVTLGTRVQELEWVESGDLLYSSRELPSGQYVELCVADAGVGIDPETAHRIFEPFYTSKEKGHGLGLPVVLGVVQGMGGAIRVAGAPRLGARFELLFPVSDLPLEPAPTADEQPATAPAADALVLIIDDEAVVRDTVADVLELGSIPSISAPDGLAGLALFQERMGEIGLVLLDQSMPGMTGTETLRALQRLDPHVRVIMTSGFDADSSKWTSGGDIAQNAVAFLQKPYDADTLLATVRRALARG